MRRLAWLAVVAPALVVGLTVLYVAESLDLMQPLPLIVAEAAALGAFAGLNCLVSTQLAARTRTDR
jgi:hypothetical protein